MWRGHAAVTVLAASAIGQATVLRAPMSDAASRSDPIPVGYDLSSVSVKHADGTLGELGAGQPTLLLVFDPDCATRVASRRPGRPGSLARSLEDMAF